MQSSGPKFLPPEWYPQSGIMLTWPHANSDWANVLDEIESFYVLLANEILKDEKLLLICPDPNEVLLKLDKNLIHNLVLMQLDSNDTWARDHGPITVFENGVPVLLDFQFNGWGMKFPAYLDNQLTLGMFNGGVFSRQVKYRNQLGFVLEGGSFESDGKGTLLTTEQCLLSVNRNQGLSKQEIESVLAEVFDTQRILWLSSGYLEGDDTDSHIDTLARFCDENTIAYVACEDSSDEHYAQLKQMEEQIKLFRTHEGNPYRLIKLPMAEHVEDNQGNRLPATYANFLIMNNKVLFPCYLTQTDAIAEERLKTAFPLHKIVGIDCSLLIWQHGSLHCITMQLPEGVL
jgi:agmatine/peptidylarginine deiminase